MGMTFWTKLSRALQNAINAAPSLDPNRVRESIELMEEMERAAEAYADQIRFVLAHSRVETYFDPRTRQFYTRLVYTGPIRHGPHGTEFVPDSGEDIPPNPPRRPPRPIDPRRLALRTLGFKTTDNPSQAEIRERYLDLAKRYHPDRNPRGAERMKKITVAYAELVDK